MIRELIAERLDPVVPKRAVGRFGPAPGRLRAGLLPPGTLARPPGTTRSVAGAEAACRFGVVDDRRGVTRPSSRPPSFHGSWTAAPATAASSGTQRRT